MFVIDTTRVGICEICAEQKVLVVDETKRYKIL
jgi:hypothetical protein